MEGESKRALKCLTNQPASVHNYGKLSKSESPRNHSSPTSILRKFPHSLRHDQKHRTKLKREISPVDLIVSGASAVDRGEGEANRFVVSRCARGEGSDDPGHGTSSEDAERRREDDEDGHDRTWKKRKFGATSSDCSKDGDVWKLRPGAARADETSVGEFVTGFPRDDSTDRSDEKTVGSAFKLSVINNPCLNGSSVNRASRPKRRSEFPVHKSTPNLLRSETFNVSTFASRPEYAADRSSGGKPPSRRELARNGRHVPLKTSDSLPQLDQTYRIIHSILPKINRTISESHESLSGLKIGTPHVKSEPHIESFPDDDDDDDRTEASRSRTFEFGKSDSSQSEDESDGLGLIEGRRSAVVQSAKDRKKRWTYKKTVDLVPGLKNFMNRRSRNGGDAEEAAPPGAAAPLMRDGSPRAESCSSLVIPQIRCFDEEDEDVSAKKREAVEALTNLIRADSHLQVEPIRPVNRLRVPPNGFYGSTSRMCSRCSSLLSMASSSRYSINTTGSGFVSCSPSLEKPSEPSLLCKLCLMEVPVSQSMEISHCGCIFCKDCMRLYVEFEIQEGAYDISCPDAQCAKQGVVTLGEVEALVTPQMMERYLRFRLNHEVDMDWNRTWCPRAGCETVCDICPREKCSPTSVHCPTCDSDFCSNCKNAWHEGLTCEGNSRKLAKEGRSDFMEPGIPFDSDSIKCCPMCNVPIEKDEGCAQMMCKRCKHVFCWYCLASLDDDFLLRHYDKGPCKNKLGHSRASVIWHRTQVIGIFAGLGLLLLVASPLLLLAAPCIVCCKCRVCSGTKLDADDDLPEESGT